MQTVTYQAPLVPKKLKFVRETHNVERDDKLPNEGHS